MLLRIVTLTYKSGEEIYRLLDSLDKFLKVPAEILIWDNGESRAVLDKWKSSHSDFRFPIHFLGSGVNLGFSRGVNHALESETGANWTHLLLMNPDAELISDFAQTHFDEIHNLGGIVGLRVWDNHEKTKRQASARSFPSFVTSLTGRQGLLTRLWPQNPWSKKYLGAELPENKISKVDWVSGCALFCSKQTWQVLGGFDERYFFAVEDVDLGKKAAKAKIPVFYYPHVDVVHFTGTTAKKVSTKADFFHHASMWAYHVKWSGPLGILVGPFVYAGIWLRFLLRRFI